MSEKWWTPGDPPAAIQCSSPPIRMRRPYAKAAIGMFAAVVGAGVIVLFAASAASRAAHSGFVLVAMGVGLLSMALIREATSASDRAEARRVASDMPRGTREDAAMRHVLLAFGSKRSGPWVDAHEWLTTFGPGAVSLGVEVPEPRGGEPVAESVDVGPGRRRKGGEFRPRARVTAAHVVLLAFGLVAAVSLIEWIAGGMVVRVSPGTPLFMLVVMAPTVLFALAAFGYRPVELTSAIAEPGRLTSVSWGRRDVFTRADAVLVVEALGGGPVASGASVLAVLVREDGKQWGQLYSGADDPGLADLYYRWVAEPGGSGPARAGATSLSGSTT
jgi:hypothetical protein